MLSDSPDGRQRLQSSAPFFQRINITDQQNHNVEQHLHKAKHFQVAVNERPRVKKNGLDIEQNKEQSHHIEVDGERLARVACGRDAALVRLIFLARMLVPADQGGSRDQGPAMPQASINISNNGP